MMNACVHFLYGQPPFPALAGRDANLKASHPMSEQTLKDRVLAEVRAETWDVPEIGRQLGCGERMVFFHFRSAAVAGGSPPASQHAGRSGKVFARALRVATADIGGNINVAYVGKDGRDYFLFKCTPYDMTDIRVGVFNSDDENERIFNSSFGDLTRGEIETTINDNEAGAFKRNAAPLKNYAEIMWSAIKCRAAEEDT
jgi:hypothetical protein